jgi:hypothetical protein
VVPSSSLRSRTEQTAQFVQGGTSGIPDRRYRPSSLCRIVGEHRVGDHGLHHDDAHAVRDDVVELTSDAKPFVDHGASGQFLTGLLELAGADLQFPGAGFQGGRVFPSSAQGVAEPPGGDDDDHHADEVRRSAQVAGDTELDGKSGQGEYQGGQGVSPPQPGANRVGGDHDARADRQRRSVRHGKGDVGDDDAGQDGPRGDPAGEQRQRFDRKEDQGRHRRRTGRADQNQRLQHAENHDDRHVDHPVDHTGRAGPSAHRCGRAHPRRVRAAAHNRIGPPTYRARHTRGVLLRAQIRVLGR